MRKRYVWLCLSLLACACGVEDNSESADLSEDFSSADQSTDQTPEDTQEDVQDVLVPDQQDEVHDLVDMPLDIPIDMNINDNMDVERDMMVHVDMQNDIDEDMIVDVDMGRDFDFADEDIQEEIDVEIDQFDMVEDIDDTTEDAIEEDSGNDVAEEYDFPIGSNYPTDRFTDLNSTWGTCAIREQDNLRYCWNYSPSRDNVEYRKLTHGGCGLTLDGDLYCHGSYFGEQFVEGPFIDVHATPTYPDSVCVVREDHSAYCIFNFDPYRTEEYIGQYKSIRSVDYSGICGITMDDRIRCDANLDNENFDFDVRGQSFVLFLEHPRDVRVKDIVVEPLGTCACALTFENTIQCWGGYREDRDYCERNVERFFPGRYSYIDNLWGAGCAITLDGLIHCGIESEYELGQINQYAPFQKVTNYPLCALKTNGQIIC